MTGAGARMAAEMAEQPAVLRRLVSRRDEVAASLVPPRRLRGVVLVARGSSDNAAVWGRYLLEWALGVPVALAAPSLQTRYDVTPDVRDHLVIGISQSGETPEIVAALARLRAGGARTWAITNAGGSALAQEAHGALVLDAGDEEAVPATKTFTAQVAALALAAEVLGDTRLWSDAEWAGAIEAVEAVVADDAVVNDVAGQLLDGVRVLPVARGFLYGAALEVGLKWAETTGRAVQGTSPADLRHGPIAAVHPGTQVVCLTAPGPVLEDVRSVARDLAQRGAQVTAIGPADAELPEATTWLEVPAGVPEPLAGLAHVVRGQQLARAAALAVGIDPDAPFALSKVTRTT